MPYGAEAKKLSIQAHFGAAHHASALGIHHWALFNGDPLSSGIEPTTVGGYARKSLTNDAVQWNITNDPLSAQLLIDVVFPMTTALWSQTTLTYWAIASASAGGDIWYSGPLSTNIVITGAGEVPTIGAGIALTQQA